MGRLFMIDIRPIWSFILSGAFASWRACWGALGASFGAAWGACWGAGWGGAGWGGAGWGGACWGGAGWGVAAAAPCFEHLNPVNWEEKKIETYTRSYICVTYHYYKKKYIYIY